MTEIKVWELMMNEKMKTILLGCGYAVMTGLFCLVLGWSLIPIGGETLPHLVEQSWGLSFHVSALVISLVCAVLAVGSMSLTLLNPAPVYRNRNEGGTAWRQD